MKMMLTKLQHAKLLLIILTMIVSFGCAGGKLTLTEDATPQDEDKLVYYQSLREYNRLVKDYTTTYKLATPATKQEWVETIKPAVLVGYTALDTWYAAIGNTSESDKEAAYMEAKAELLKLLFKVGIFKLKE